MTLEDGECAFPELLHPGTTAVLIGVDPDVNGALATLRWRNAGALAGATPLQLVAAAEAEVHDMPIEIWKLGKRDKKHPDAVALDALLRAMSGGGALDPGGTAVVRAAVEYTTPQHLSGKHAWYGIGFASGLLGGVMVAQGLPFERVNAAAWKRQMGLLRQGKEGSLALAAQLFPELAKRDLKRKKDHGRAEALLIAAFALGVRAKMPVGAAADEGEADAEAEAEAEGAEDVRDEERGGLIS